MQTMKANKWLDDKTISETDYKNNKTKQKKKNSSGIVKRVSQRPCWDIWAENQMVKNVKCNSLKADQA